MFQAVLHQAARLQPIKLSGARDIVGFPERNIFHQDPTYRQKRAGADAAGPV